MTAEGGDVDARYLKTPRAVRERSEEIYRLAENDALEHWKLDAAKLEPVAERVIRTTRKAYPDLKGIPYHSRWRHFSAGGVDRARALEQRLVGCDEDERLAARFDLVILSVLLDAGAGELWRYRDPRGETYARSEGIAVASCDLFFAGAFSKDPTGAPLRADADALERTTASSLAKAFQINERNPMVGLEGRAELLQRLGSVARALPGEAGRLGDLGIRLRRAALSDRGELAVSTLFATVLDGLASIWPGREGKPLGDVWTHSSAGAVPFHKLSQWLTYSLVEPLEWSGVSMTGVGELTGLAEYRNGGLFIDAGVLVPKHAGVLRDEHDVGSDVVIEWRALTVALLDRTARRVRAIVGLSEEELPLAKVLEGGTWRAGRELAAEMRADGGPPLRVRRDGTVF